MQTNKPKPTINKHILLASIVLLAAFLWLTFLRPSLHGFDTSVNLLMLSIQSNAVTIAAKAIAVIFDTTGLLIISLAVAVGLFFLKRKQYGLLLLTALGGDVLVVEVLKRLEQVARPTNSIFPGSGYAYPSGHSAGIVVFCGILAYFAWRHWQSTRSRAAIGVGLGGLVGVVGFDRVYLNAHWLSDVLGGWLFGAFWVLLVVLVFEWLECAGKFGSRWSNVVANGLYVVAFVIAVLIVVF